METEWEVAMSHHTPNNSLELANTARTMKISAEVKEPEDIALVISEETLLVVVIKHQKGDQSRLWI